MAKAKISKQKFQKRTPLYTDEDLFHSYSDDCCSLASDDDSCDPELDSQYCPLQAQTLSFQTIQPIPSRKKNSKKERHTKQFLSKNLTQETLLDRMPFEPRGRLIKSKSSPSLFRDDCTTHQQVRRLSGCTSSVDQTPLSLPHNRPNTCIASHCMQSLIMPTTRLSVIGPSPRASLPILSDLGRAAILILWCPLRVVPLVNCSPSVALACRNRIEQEMHHEDLSLNNKWLSFWKITTFLVERRDLWIQVLDNLVDEEVNSVPFEVLTKACRQAGMTLGTSCSQYKMLQDYLAANPPSFRNFKVESDDTYEAVGDHSCPICLDEVTSPCQLFPCAHVACLSCYKSFITSASKSGEGSIPCAAYKCQVQIDLLDVGHILDDNDAEVFQRVVKFTLERSASLQSRFCPAPRCGRRYKVSSTNDTTGFNLTICDCGTFTCNVCENGGGPAHPGLSCSDFSWLQKSIDSELANVEWVLRHTRPCPKCRYPIQKDGGCNHVRCRQCMHYFCFECGGEGNLCNAYECFHSSSESRYWESNRTYITHGDRVKMYGFYRSTAKKLTIMIEEMKSCKEADLTNKKLELQCAQVLLWSLAQSLCVDRACSTKNVATKGIIMLDRILEAFALRKTKDVPFLTSNWPKTPLVDEQNTFENLFQQQELLDLLKMDDFKFSQRVKDAILKGVQTFARQEPIKPSLPPRKAKALQDAMSLSPLNEKQRRPNASWRSSSRRGTEEGVITDDSKLPEDDTRNEKNAKRWKKNKVRVSVYRAKALENSDL